jgi:voltage-gated potassium channel
MHTGSTARRRVRIWLRKMVVKVANDFRIIVLLYVVSLILGGASFALLEDRSIGDGMWWAVVTALTIGYGDLAPATGIGRVVAACFQHFWAYGMIPLIAVNLLTHVVRDDNQFSHDEQEWQETAIKAIADHLGVELPPSPADTDYTD